MDDSCANITCGDVPTVMYQLMERTRLLLTTIDVLNGWSSEFTHLRASSIRSVVSAAENVVKVKLYLRDVEAEIEALERQRSLFLHLKQRILYIANNLPKRFNKITETTTLTTENTGSIQQKVQPTPAQPIPVVPPVSYITKEEFDAVPKYMKQRIPYEKINSIIDLFNSVLKQKYSLLRKKRSALKKIDADRVIVFKQQEVKETNGLYFCVLGDLQSLGGAALDKSLQNILTILRHCSRLREVRSSGFVRLVAMY